MRSLMLAGLVSACGGAAAPAANACVLAPDRGLYARDLAVPVGTPQFFAVSSTATVLRDEGTELELDLAGGRTMGVYHEIPIGLAAGTRLHVVSTPDVWGNGVPNAHVVLRQSEHGALIAALWQGNAYGEYLPLSEPDLEIDLVPDDCAPVPHVDCGDVITRTLRVRTGSAAIDVPSGATAELGGFTITHALDFVYPDPIRCLDAYDRWTSGAVVRRR